MLLGGNGILASRVNSLLTYLQLICLGACRAYTLTFREVEGQD